MRDALKQMDKALNGPDGFEDGIPYGFDSRTREEAETRGIANEERVYPNSRMLNVPAPNDSATADMIAPPSDWKKLHLVSEKSRVWALANEHE